MASPPDARGVAIRVAVDPSDSVTSPQPGRSAHPVASSPAVAVGAASAPMLALLRSSPLVYRAALRAQSPVDTASSTSTADIPRPSSGPRRGSTSPSAASGQRRPSPVGFHHTRVDGSGVSPYVIRTAELRTERYLRGRTSPGPYAAGTTTPTRSPQGRMPSPRNGRSSPTPSNEAEGRNARLATLVTEFEQHSLRPWSSKVSDINGRFERLNYVSEEELRFLRHVRRRCETFQASLKTILTDGVVAGVGVDVLLARQARELNSACDDLAAQMVRILRYANGSNATDAITGRVERPSQRQLRSASTESRRSNLSSTPDTQPRGGSVRGSSPVSTSSPAPRRAVSPVPSLQDIPKPPVRVVNPSLQVEPETLRREDKKRMLEGIVSLEKRSSLSPSDLEWAESIFHRLYGTQKGMEKFHAWCKALTDTPLLLRPTYSRNGGVASRTALIDQLPQ